VRYPDNDSVTWRLVEPLLAQRIETGRYLAVRENASGEVTWMFIGNEAYEKLRPKRVVPLKDRVVRFLLTVRR
jgi:hypothetical protein